MILAMNGEQALVAASPKPTDVRKLTQEVWGTFLGEHGPLEVGTDLGFAPDWSASVSVKGEWNGVVALEMTTSGAQRLTRSMLGLETSEELVDGDLVDAIGEMVNMIGGNVKGLVRGPCRLSLPLVAAGRFAHGSGQREVVRLGCTWAAEPLAITVHAGRPAKSLTTRPLEAR
ncbi:chemotaxis protein CheX [Nocardioides solisilvae]|uniref:chemotaxis protein CheX n=1 Tax=Nocardioides solisilvae TaxID=1542435 RepID=UPI0013A55EFE|nr:chemotaxis protein CheX [Nocardioides solisilvae]